MHSIKIFSSFVTELQFFSSIMTSLAKEITDLDGTKAPQVYYGCHFEWQYVTAIPIHYMMK